MRAHAAGLGFLAMLLLAAGTLPAQTGSGIRGTVTDSSGAAVPGARVTATNVDTGLTRTATTDTAGVYTFTLLPVGGYSLAVEAQGFKTHQQSNIRLTTNEVAGLNVVLEVGALSERVEVSAGAPLVNTQTTETGTLIGTQQVVELPLNGRNVIQLATLTNGVAAERVHTALTGGDERNASAMAVNGNRTTMTQFNLDGGEFAGPLLNSGINYPNPDAVQEFRFITSNYSAEFGRNPGGVMNVITRSGTNEFHGSLWEFNRNSNFAARSFFLPRVAFLNQNQFGFSAGGPAIRNKLFFFGTGQWFKIRQGRATTGSFPPTEAEKRGDFSAQTTPIRDPLTQQPFPGNQIPVSRLDPVALKLANLLPAANSPDGRFLGSFAEPVNNHQYLIKSDYNLSDRSRLSFSWFRDNTDSTSLLDFGRLSLPLLNTTGRPDKSSGTDIRQAVANWTHGFSPTVINQFRFGYVRLNLDVSAEGRGPTLNDLTSQFPAQPFQDIPGFNVSGRWSAGTGNFNIFPSDDLQFSDSINLIRGRHNLKFGAEFRHWNHSFTSTANNMAIFLPNGSVTGTAISDFFMGRARMFVSNSWASDSTQKGFASYVQDDFKVSRNLVVNLGLRYQVTSMFSPAATVAGEGGKMFRPAGGFNEGQQSTVLPTAPRGLVYPGDAGVASGVVPTDKNDVAPRVGLAWDVFGNGKTSVRGGWGLFYTTPNGSDITSATQNPPFFVNFLVDPTPSFVNPLPQLSAAFPVRYGENLNFSNFFPMSIQSLALNYRNAQIQQWNFTIQQELPGRISLQAAYVGNRAADLLYFRRINPSIYIPGNDASGNPLSTLTNTNQRRRLNQQNPNNPVYGDVALGEPLGTSDYHSLQLQVRKEFSRGLNLLASYTYGKAIDTSSVTLSCAFGGSAPAQNPDDINGDRGLANFDQRQRLVLSFIYETPSVTKATGIKNPVAKAVLDDWEVGTIASLGSGFPFTVVSGRDNSLTAYLNDRPNLVGNPVLDTNRPRGELLTRYFDPAAFAPNLPGQFGNVGRNTLIGPGSVNIDFSVYKNIPISERRGRLQLRLEFFNLPNRPNFGSPGSSLAAPGNMGRILGAGPGRIIQMGGKYQF